MTLGRELRVRARRWVGLVGAQVARRMGVRRLAVLRAPNTGNRGHDGCQGRSPRAFLVVMEDGAAAVAKPRLTLPSSDCTPGTASKRMEGRTSACARVLTAALFAQTNGRNNSPILRGGDKQIMVHMLSAALLRLTRTF